jgi:hypothetical protein
LAIVAIFSHLADYTFEITNDDDEPMTLKKWQCSTAVGDISSSEGIHRTEVRWEEFRHIWDDQSDDVGVVDDHTPIPCEMLQNLICPTKSQEEFERVKNLWGKAYPSMCPGCAVWADKQCKFLVISTTTSLPIGCVAKLLSISTALYLSCLGYSCSGHNKMTQGGICIHGQHSCFCEICRSNSSGGCSRLPSRDP